MDNGVKCIPDGMRAIIPHLIVNGGNEAVEFYKKAFGAVEMGRAPAPGDTRLMHAAVKIGEAVVFLCDEFPEWGCGKSPKTLGGASVTLTFYVEDVDRAYQKAVDAGATPTMPPANMFWGDRYGKLLDPFGHEWALATHVEDVPPEDMERRMKAAMANCVPA
jgi:PhnB protein